MKYAVIFGGSSFEHEISIVSAITIKDKLKNSIFIFVDKNRDFYLINRENMKSKYFAQGEYRKSPKLELKKGGFFQKKGLFKKEEKVDFDVALNLIHGRDGEDGKIPAMLSFYGIKAITPDIEASVISYNKLLTKAYAKEIEVNVIDYEIIDSPSVTFDFPVIIKPARLGSSIGVSVVKNQNELEYAFDVAREFDDLILAEPFICGIEEYNLAGCKAGDEWIFSKLEKVEKKEFLDFDKKYMDFSRKEAKADENLVLKEKIEEIFKKIYGNVFTNALIRCDFFYKDGNIYLNEINPIPGSMANYLFEDFEKVINRLAQKIKTEKEIKIDYAYINKIQMAKGK